MARGCACGTAKARLFCSGRGGRSQQHCCKCRRWQAQAQPQSDGPAASAYAPRWQRSPAAHTPESRARTPRTARGSSGAGGSDPRRALQSSGAAAVGCRRRRAAVPPLQPYETQGTPRGQAPSITSPVSSSLETPRVPKALIARLGWQTVKATAAAAPTPASTVRRAKEKGLKQFMHLDRGQWRSWRHHMHRRRPHLEIAVPFRHLSSSPSRLLFAYNAQCSTQRPYYRTRSNQGHLGQRLASHRCRGRIRRRRRRLRPLGLLGRSVHKHGAAAGGLHHLAVLRAGDSHLG